VVWHLLLHWTWPNVLNTIPEYHGQKINWLILDCLCGYENFVNAHGLVVENAFEKGYNWFHKAQLPHFQRTTPSGAQVPDFKWLTEHLV
jgi:hypothetical protein